MIGDTISAMRSASSSSGLGVFSTTSKNSVNCFSMNCVLSPCKVMKVFTRRLNVAALTFYVINLSREAAKRGLGLI